MKNRIETIIFIVVCAVIAWFVYLDRGILTPFIVAAIFAYLTNPIVLFFMHALRLSRTKAVSLFFVLFLTITFFIGFTAIRQLFLESVELQRDIGRLLHVTQTELGSAPVWIRGLVDDTLLSIQTSDYLSPKVVLLLFPQAISRVLSFIIFGFSAFFLLKDGRKMIHAAVGALPSRFQADSELLLQRINAVLNSYLRGQLILIAWVSGVLFIVLTIMGVRFALLIAIFSGFAEIIPFIGPIIATCTAVFVVLITGTINFSLPIVQGAILVGVIFIVIRQLQDYIITPFVMQKATNLHPLVILFSVLSGEHLFGVLGLLLAVPVVASIRVIWNFARTRLEENKKISRERNKPDSVHPD